MRAFRPSDSLLILAVLCFALTVGCTEPGPPLQEPADWENPEMIGRNKETAHAKG